MLFKCFSIQYFTKMYFKYTNFFLYSLMEMYYTLTIKNGFN